MGLEELQQLIQTLRTNGVLYYECGDVKLQLTPLAPEAPKVEKAKEDVPDLLKGLPDIYSHPKLGL